MYRAIDVQRRPAFSRARSLPLLMCHSRYVRVFRPGNRNVGSDLVPRDYVGRPCGCHWMTVACIPSLSWVVLCLQVRMDMPCHPEVVSLPHRPATELSSTISHSGCCRCARATATNDARHPALKSALSSAMPYAVWWPFTGEYHH